MHDDLFSPDAPTASAATVVDTESHPEAENAVHGVWTWNDEDMVTPCGQKMSRNQFVNVTFSDSLVTCSDCLATLKAAGLSGLTASDRAVAQQDASVR